MTTLAERSGAGWRLWALVPLLLLVGVVALFAATGGSVLDLLGRTPPPADEFDVRRVEFKPGEIRVRVTNPQQEDLTIAQVTVDDAIVPYHLDGDQTLSRLRSATIVIPFAWVEDEPIAVGVTSSTGIQTTHEIAAAVETPDPSAKGVLGFGVIGLLVGVVPQEQHGVVTTRVAGAQLTAQFEATGVRQLHRQQDQVGFVLRR